MRHFFHEQKRIRIRQAGEGYPKASIQGRNQAQNAPAGRGKKETLDKMKTCSKCKAQKPLTDFHVCNRSKDGRANYCKKCQHEFGSQWRRNNLAKCRSYNKKSRLKHPDKVKERDKRWRHTEKSRIYHRQWRRKILSTLKGNLNNRMSSAIRRTLRLNKNGYKWETLTGYTTGDLYKHLESRFNNGMSWINFGKWHIDHIVPISNFNYQKATDPEFRSCWALSNLQPMWAEENLRKGNKHPQSGLATTTARHRKGSQ